MSTSGLVQSKWSPNFARDPMCSWFYVHTKNEFITYIYISFYQSSINCGWFSGYFRHNGGFGILKRQISALNVNAICDQRHANVSKQTKLLGGVDVDQPKWRACGRGLNRSVHEGMNDISNVKIHLRTRSGNILEIIFIFRMFMAVWTTVGLVQSKLAPKGLI